jgi:hypothetical protein
MDPVRIQVFRNCGFELTVPMFDEEQFPIALTGYSFGMVIAATPVPPTGAFGTPALQTYFPGSGSGSVSFAFPAEETAMLSISTAYQYSALGQAPGAEPAVLQYGSVQLIDTPGLPAPRPHLASP